MVVVDTSALIDALIGGPYDQLRERLAAEPEYAVPELTDLEFHEALRGLVRSRAVQPERAETAREDYGMMTLDRFPHTPFLDRVWELRGQLTAYDACYVALAEALEIPLVTTDRRLARSKGHRAEIELY